MKNYNKSYLIITQSSRFYRIFFYLVVTCYLFIAIATASGGYDNGTATGKGKLGLDLTWNPFNYFPEGQTYAVVSYGLSEKFDLHGYYSNPTNGLDNYYFGFFYQFTNNEFMDIATAIGIRQYIPKTTIQLFLPQVLYTINLFNELKIGGSFVTIRDLEKDKVLGTTVDIALVIPILKYSNKYDKIDTVDYCIGAFRPILWQPKKWDWHPTYSIDIKFRI